MSLAEPISFPFYEGSTVSIDVPSKFDVALAGRGFMLDLASGLFSHDTIPVIRSQQDGSDEPGGQSLDPQGLWHRIQDDWSHGAGQTHYDRPTSDRARFRSSKGADVWTPHQMGLLFDTALRQASAATNLQLLVANGYCYAAYGNEVYSSVDVSAGIATSRDVHDGETPQSVKSLATNGTTVYAALGSNGIHSGAAGSDFAHFSDQSATLLGFAKGRLMAANGAAIFNIVAAGASPGALFAHPNANFTWVGFAEGPGGVYAAGYAGDLSSVYRTTIKADGTALDTPTHAGSLLPGEIIRTIRGYLGKYLRVGTDKGWRLLVLNDVGDIVDSSDLIPTTSAVLCFEDQDHYIWYGMSNYDGQSTGLGRADPGVFTKNLNPAYATDLMAAAQGAVQSVVTYAGKKVFAVSGVGFYQETTTRVPQGTLNTGLIRFGIPQQKIAMFVDVRHDPLAGSVAAYLSLDNGAFNRVGIDTNAGGISGPAFPAGQGRGEVLEVRYELNRSAVDTTTGPTVTQGTLMVNPVVDSGEFITAPLIIGPVYDTGMNDEPRDAGSDKAFLRALRSDRSVVPWQEGTDIVSVTVEDYSFKGYKMIEIDGKQFFIGTWAVKLKTIPEAA